MALTISYFILFGIISFTNGKPSAKKEDSYFIKNEYELQKLLQVLSNQGKYDIALSHHEDGPKSHHKDRAHISHRDDKPSKYFRNDKSNSGRNYVSYEQLDRDDHQPSLSNIQNLNLYYKKKPNNLQRLSDNENDILEQLLEMHSDNKNRQGKEDDEMEYDNAEDILAFLSDLQNNLADDGNYKSQLRCVGNKCARSRYANDRDNDDDRNDRDDLRCRGNRCDRDRDDRANDRHDRDGLRCKGKSCARNRDGRSDRYDYDRNDRDDDYGREDRDNLRCRGNKCARTKNDNYDDNLKYDSKLYAKKYRVSDDLDAVVLDISDIDRLLSKVNTPRQQGINKSKSKSSKLEHIDLNSLIDYKGGNDKSSNVEAVVFDLTQVEDGDVMAKQIKRLLSQAKQPSEGDYEEYGNLVEENLKRGSFNFEKPVYQDKSNSKILAHNEDNNNVYVPKWLLNEVVSKSTLRQSPQEILKSLFPLTQQQKERLLKVLESKQGKSKSPPKKIFRRNFEQDVGVPFHLEVQGLGQVNP